MASVSKESQDCLEDLGIGFKKHTANGKTINAFYFDSYTDLIDKLNLAYQTKKWIPYRYRDNDSWYFGSLRTYQACVDSLREGRATKKQLDIAKTIYEQIQSSPEVQALMQRAVSIKRKKAYSDEGSELCIDRVMAGDPAHWQKVTRGARRPLVRIGANINGNAGESEERFAAVAAAAAVIGDIVQKAGFSVEIYSCSTSERSNQLASLCCNIKHAEAPMDLNNICAVGLPIILRHFAFTVRGNAMRVDGGMFSSVSIPPVFCEELGFDHIIDADQVLERDYRSVKVSAINNIFNKILNQH